MEFRNLDSEVYISSQACVQADLKVCLYLPSSRRSSATDKSYSV